MKSGWRLLSPCPVSLYWDSAVIVFHGLSLVVCSGQAGLMILLKRTLTEPEAHLWLCLGRLHFTLQILERRSGREVCTLKKKWMQIV